MMIALISLVLVCFLQSGKSFVQTTYSVVRFHRSINRLSSARQNIENDGDTVNNINRNTASNEWNRILDSNIVNEKNSFNNHLIDHNPIILSNSNSVTKESIIKNTGVLISCLMGNILLGNVLPAVADDDLLEKIGTEAAVGTFFDPIAASKFAAEVERNRALNSDEFIVKFENSSLGLGKISL